MMKKDTDAIVSSEHKKNQRKPGERRSSAYNRETDPHFAGNNYKLKSIHPSSVEGLPLLDGFVVDSYTKTTVFEDGSSEEERYVEVIEVSQESMLPPPTPIKKNNFSIMLRPIPSPIEIKS